MKTPEHIRSRGRAYYQSRMTNEVYRRNVILRNIRYKCKRLGIPFNITTQDLIAPDKCPVLGISLKRSPKGREEYSPSCDRIIPSKGYVKGNIIIVSTKANTIKNNATPEEIKKVADFYLRFASDQEDYTI